MNSRSVSFIEVARHPLKFRLFLLSKLPSAFFSGVRINYLDELRCVTSVPYKWFTRNPFRSTYFACLAMAAEMSTGSLALVHIYNRTPSVSLLVVKLEAFYYKKAVGLTLFTCKDGASFKSSIEEAITSGEGREFKAQSTGRNKAGEKVADFYVTWSFKVRKTQQQKEPRLPRQENL